MRIRHAFCSGAAVLLAALVAPLPAADGPFDAAATAKRLAPFLDDGAVAVVRLDITALDVDTAAARLSKIASLDARFIEPAQKAAREMLGSFRQAGARELYAVLSLTDLPTPGPFVLVPLGDGANPEGIRQALTGLGMETTDTIGGAVFAGGKATRDRLRGLKPSARPELQPALAAVSTSPVQIVLAPSPDQRRAVVELMPTLPPELGGGPGTLLTRGIRWGAIGLDISPKLGLRLIIQSEDAASAHALADIAGRGLQVAAKDESIKHLLPKFPEMLPVVTPTAAGDRLTLSLGEVNMDMIAALTDGIRRRAAETAEMNNFKQIALAMHTHAGAFRNNLPAHAIYSKDGKTPLLSWRVAILPYIEQNNLYQQFKLDEPWDSEHNKKLIPLMPKTYQLLSAPPSREPGLTHFQVFIGGGAPWERGPTPPMLPRTFFDGTSNTILIAEAGEPAIWTKPEDLTYDPKLPLPKLGTQPGFGFLVVMADGAVRRVSAQVTEKTLRAAITAAGGEALGPDWNR